MISAISFLRHASRRSSKDVPSVGPLLKRWRYGEMCFFCVLNGGEWWFLVALKMAVLKGTSSINGG